jgi:hypothetical protein
MSKAMYFPMGLKNLTGVPPLGEYCKIIIQDATGKEIEIKTKKKDKTAIFQAISSIYGGQDLWNSDLPRAVDDGLFEFILHGGTFSLGMNQIGIQLQRCIMQGKHMTIDTSSQSFIQVDGEGQVLRSPARIILEHTGKYPMLKRF